MELTFLENWSHQLKLVFYGVREQQAFLEDVVTMIDDGVPANKAVEAFSRISTGTNAEVAQSIVEKIAEGKLISDGMIGWFPEHIVELIRAGETGGTLSETMHSAADSLQRRSSALTSLAGSLTYPIIVLVMGLVVTVYLNQTIFKEFREIRPISEWPAVGRHVVELADFVQQWWWVVIILIVAGAYAIARLLRNYTGEYRQYIDATPVFALYRETSAARFMETLGLLISNGVVFKYALKLLQFQASPYMASHLLVMEQRLGMGKANIAEVLDTGMISTEDIVRLQVTAASKGFEHALIRMGKRAGDHVGRTIRRAGNILGGVLLAAGAGLAAFMVLSIYEVGASLATGG